MITEPKIQNNQLISSNFVDFQLFFESRMRYLPVISLSILLLSLGSLAIGPSPAEAMTGQICRYNSEGNKPNPLGMRAVVSLTQQGGDTTVTYSQFPSNVGGTIPATIASERMLFFPKMAIAQVRELLLKDPRYYNELLASQGNSFAEMNAVLRCDATTGIKPAAKPVATSPTTSPESKPVSIAQLPDGNYRFWNGTATKAILSNDELIKLGGALALIHKKGNQVTAGFAYIDSDVTACVTGVVSGNKVTGQAFPDSGATTKTMEFINVGPAKFLMVRNPKPIGGKNGYSEAILDLTGFSRINLGDRAPRKSCF
jgi:hypothetical protein